MNQYIATFYAHFGAIRYKKFCEKQGIYAKIMPVPRTLSSSCGTCVLYTADNYICDDTHIDEIEQIVMVKEDGYEQVFYSMDD